MYFFVKFLFFALVLTTLHQGNGESIFKKLAHDIENVADKFAHDVKEAAHDVKKGFDDFGHDVKDAADDVDNAMKKFGHDVEHVIKDFESEVKDAYAKAKPFLKLAKIIVKDIELPLSEITEVAELLSILAA